MFTSSFVWTSSPASVAMTSFAFMFEDVPEPVWKTSIGNWSSSSPFAIRSPASAMRAALSSSSSPSSAFTRAAAALMRPSQRATGVGIGWPETGKLSTALRVSPPQSSFRSAVATNSSLATRDLQKGHQLGELHVAEGGKLVAAADRRVEERLLLRDRRRGDREPHPRPRDLVPDDAARDVEAEPPGRERREVERALVVEAHADDQPFGGQHVARLQRLLAALDHPHEERVQSELRIVRQRRDAGHCRGRDRARLERAGGGLRERRDLALGQRLIEVG